MRYIELYQQGFCETVWRELHKLSLRGSSYEIRDDIECVAVEFAMRAKRNLLVIKDVLTSLSYPFRNPDRVVIEAGSDASFQLDEFEKQHGSLPVAIRAWNMVVHEVDFRQELDALERERNGLWRDSIIAGLGFNCNLVFESFEVCRSKVQRGFLPHESRKVLPTGACGTNGDPMGAGFPSKDLDFVFYNDGAGDVMFGEFIRRSCMWGGFPLWRNMRAMTPDQLGFQRFPNVDEYYNVVIPKMEVL